MVIRNEASAGAAESADVLVTVRPAETLELRIASTVRLQFGAAIEQTVHSVLRAADVQQGEIAVDDHGALDWILRARLEAALARAEGGTAWAAANGIVNGYGDSLFGPNDPVTREQLAAILYRYAVYGGMTTVTLEENLGSFADTAQLSAYAIQAMNWAVGQGLINGSGSNLVPKAQATRAQVAAIIHRYLER